MTPVVVAAFAAAFIALARFSYSYAQRDSEIQNKQRSQKGDVTLSQVEAISFHAVVKSSAVALLPCSLLRKSVGIGTGFCDPFPFFAFAVSS